MMWVSRGMVVVLFLFVVSAGDRVGADDAYLMKLRNVHYVSAFCEVLREDFVLAEKYYALGHWDEFSTGYTNRHLNAGGDILQVVNILYYFKKSLDGGGLKFWQANCHPWAFSILHESWFEEPSGETKEKLISLWDEMDNQLKEKLLSAYDNTCQWAREEWASPHACE